MARRPASSTTEAPEVPEEETPDTDVEAPEEEGTEEETVETDLTDFKAAVEVAVATKDATSGELPTASLEPVRAEYRKLNGAKGKNAAKRYIDAAVRSAMNALDIQTARAHMELLDKAMTAAGSGTKAPEKAPADPTEAFVNLVAGLRMALEMVDEPEGLKDGWNEQVEALIDAQRQSARDYVAWSKSDDEDKGEEPEIPGFVKAAVKLSQGRAAKVSKASGTSTPFTGERRNIGKHIEEAFAGVESGTFLTVAEIRNHRSEEYGDNPPSAGAISARLFPSSGKSTLEGITPGTNEKGNKGATKQ
jgi:hypothetical protein